MSGTSPFFAGIARTCAARSRYAGCRTQGTGKGFYGREPGIACTHPVSPISFEMFEELENGRDVKMADLELAGPDAVFVRREDDQKLEAEGITFNGMPARAPVARKIFPQEHRQGGASSAIVLPPFMQPFGCL